MKLGLEGKVVVITGGTAGIGKSCAKMFLDEGCSVVVCGRSEKNLKSFTEEFSDLPVHAVQADVSRPEDMERLAEEAEKAFGGIDIWINNAGIYPKADLEHMPLEEWRQCFAVNVDGVLFGARAAITRLRKRGGGVIINASSYAALMPTSGRSAYGISKAAVSHMTRLLAAEFAPDNVRVVAYMPGFILTDLTEAQLAEAPSGSIEGMTALNRVGTPEEIASVVVFLASQAAAFITGCGIEISGGKYTVQNPRYAWSK